MMRPDAAGSGGDDVVLTVDEMREVDRRAIEEFGLPGIVLMENAARALQRAARRMIGPPARSRRVVIVCGSGNNGGDGWALARLLANDGDAVEIVALAACRPGSDAACMASVARRMGICVRDACDPWSLAGSALIVDAIFGTGLDRAPDALAAKWIDAINASGVPVLAADVPSGFCARTGRALGPAIRASCTVTFAARKSGFVVPGAAHWLGDVEVGDIGVPQILLCVGRRAGAGDPGITPCARLDLSDGSSHPG